MDQHTEQRKSRIRRLIGVTLIGVTPIAALIWAGCSDDESSAFGPTYVDPGGTHGAEVSISVIGRGRVTANVPGVDCPSDCFAKYVFSSAGADGASGSVVLKATPTPNSRFKGWSFSTDPVGARGRGPESCNPVMRPGTDPAVDKNAAEIQLPYGEVAGTAPGAACGAYTKVPLVYNVTATFETDPIIDSGIEGGDGGELDIVYSAPQTGALSRDIGMTQNGRLFWHFQASGQSGVAYGSSPTSSGVPMTPQVLSPLPDSAITLFEVDPYGLAYQTSLGTISVVRYSTTSVTTIPGVSPTCTALAVDSSYNVYCRTTSSIVMWPYPSYTSPTTLYTGVPSGTDLVVENSGGPLYFTGSSAVLSLPAFGTDGGVASPTTLISGRFNPRGLEANGSYFWWLESTTSFYTSSSKSGSPTAINATPPSGTSGYQFIAQDPNSSAYFWFASSSAIYRATNNVGAATTQPFREGLQNIGGIAVDYNYVYWTQLSDGVIRRASRLGF